MNPPIVLLTDFGHRDHYVGTMKGVIHSIHPEASLIDLAHEVVPQQVLEAAFMLRNAYPYFPVGSVFVCVVDPEVGTDRKILCVKTRNHYFLAPDNGLLTWVLEQEKKSEIRNVDNRRYFLGGPLAATFHGRDIFSPVAAHLARKDIFARLGPRVSKVRKLRLPHAQKKARELRGQILYFDRFGNGITNIRQDDAEGSFWQKAQVTVGRRKIGMLQPTYGTGHSLRALFNSFSHLEIAYPCDSAEKRGPLKVGDPVNVSSGQS